MDNIGGFFMKIFNDTLLKLFDLILIKGIFGGLYGRYQKVFL